jgi:hypothetical protein
MRTAKPTPEQQAKRNKGLPKQHHRFLLECGGERIGETACRRTRNHRINYIPLLLTSLKTMRSAERVFFSIFTRVRPLGAPDFSENAKVRGAPFLLKFLRALARGVLLTGGIEFRIQESRNTRKSHSASNNQTPGS